MTIPSIQTSFNSGEISPELYGEVDLKKLSSAATTARNMFVAYRGGLQSRAGLAFVGRCKQRALMPPPRPIPFQFSITQGVILEFGEQYLRFVFDGGYIVEPAVNIENATQANPCQIDVMGTPFSNNDWVFINDVNGMTQLNGQTFIVQNSMAGSFTLEDLDNNPIDSTTYNAYISGGIAARLYTLNTPYASIDLPYLKFCQSADVMALTCSNPETQTEYPPYELKRLGAVDWTLTQVSFDAVISPPSSVSASANRRAPSSGINATFAYEVTAVDKAGNESIASAPASCNGADLVVEGGTNTVQWNHVVGATSYNVYRAPPAVDSPPSDPLTGNPNPVPAGSIFGFSGSSFGTQYLDNAPTVDLTQTPPLHEDPLAPGQILAVNITSAGDDLTDVSWVINTTTGSGFTGYPVVIGGRLGAFVITSPGKFYQPGDSIVFDGVGFASGAIVFSVNPTAGDTITLNGVTWTFVAAVTGQRQTLITGALSDTITGLVSGLSAASNPLLTVASYSQSSDNNDLLIVYDMPGPAGNAYTLAASAATPSGPTLTGGSTGIGTAPTATLDVGPQSGTYPGVNTYFQQRRFFANSFNNPDTFWASQTGLFYNFDNRIPTQGTDAITASPWTEQVNGIQWLIPMPGGLIAMTGKRAWQILGDGTYQFNVQPLTPSSVQAQPQAFNGSSPTIPPIVENYDVLYVQAIGNSTVRDLAWNLLTNIYTGSDLTILSSHLFLNYKLTQWAWAREPYKVLWAVREDGILLSFTYLKEQEVYGWARHDTQGLVQGVATITEPPVDAIYAVVKRFPPNPNQLHGIYTMERMDDRLWQSVEDAYAVDAGISNPMTFPDTPIQANSPTGPNAVFVTDVDVFSAANVGDIIRMAGGIAEIITYSSPQRVQGKWILPASNGAFGIPYETPGRWSISTPVTSLRGQHLAGLDVVALADGIPVTGLTADAMGNVSWGFAASDVKVGLSYTCQMQTPYINGGEPTPQGRRKVIPACTVRLAASAVFQIGTNQPDGAAQNPPQLAPTWANLATPELQDQGATQYQSYANRTVTQLWTGDIRQTIKSDWRKPGQIAVQQTLPMALEVTAVIPEVLPGDTPEVTYAAKPQPDQGSRPQGPGKHMLRI